MQLRRGFGTQRQTGMHEKKTPGNSHQQNQAAGPTKLTRNGRSPAQLGLT